MSRTFAKGLGVIAIAISAKRKFDTCQIPLALNRRKLNMPKGTSKNCVFGLRGSILR